MTTPKEDGLFMPAEWQAHSQCWMAWPSDGSMWGDRLPAVEEAYAAVASAIADFERYVEANPQETEGWALLANAYKEAGLLEGAARAQRNCGRVFYLGGVEALNKGDRSQAAELFAWALKFDPGYEPANRAMTQLRAAVEASGESPGG